MSNTPVSMVTRCPHCGTVFKLSQRQLESHRGIVRCGKCDQIFNAHEKLSAFSPHAGTDDPNTDIMSPQDEPAEPQQQAQASQDTITPTISQPPPSSPEPTEVAKTKDQGPSTQGPATIEQQRASGFGPATQPMSVEQKDSPTTKPVQPDPAQAPTYSFGKIFPEDPPDTLETEDIVVPDLDFSDLAAEQQSPGETDWQSTILSDSETDETKPSAAKPAGGRSKNDAEDDIDTSDLALDFSGLSLTPNIITTYSPPWERNRLKPQPLQNEKPVEEPAAEPAKEERRAKSVPPKTQKRTARLEPEGSWEAATAEAAPMKPEPEPAPAKVKPPLPKSQLIVLFFSLLQLAGLAMAFIPKTFSPWLINGHVSLSLMLSIAATAVSLSNVLKRQTRFSWIYLVTGFAAFTVGFFVIAQDTLRVIDLSQQHWLRYELYSIFISATVLLFIGGFLTFQRDESGTRSGFWGVMSALLLFGCIGQLYYFRNTLVTQYPDTRPILGAICAQFNCSLVLPKDIALLSIEASDLQRLQDGSMLVVSAIIVNRAPYVQAYSFLDLTLTDTHEQIVARRIFHPVEYLPRQIDFRRGIAGNSEMTIKLYIRTADISAVGYRLNLFYP